MSVSHSPRATPQAIVVGVSTGAVSALSEILTHLPSGFPLPIMVVVHIPADATSTLVDLFKDRCQMDVCEAEDKEPIQAGTIYFAPPDYHLLVETNKRLSLSSEEPVLYSRPSIDVLFESAADAYGEGLIGIVLTGASSDGARGLKAVMEANGTGWIQCPEQARAAAMPEAAIEACPSAQVFSLRRIAQLLQEIAKE